MFYPLKLKPVLKDIIWGGNTLSKEFGYGEDNQKIAEAWTLTLREDGENIIENGIFAGKTLGEYVKHVGFKNVTGTDTDKFPLLIKLIDACDKLSVQVHPDDKYAKENGLDSGKTEMWYVLSAKPGAKLVYGLNKSVDFTNDEFISASKDGTLDKYLNFANVKKGDVFFIPAGLVHAIGEGILIAEVQQNSNTTFRIYDYNRTDKSGNKRQLHIESALKVINKSLPEKDNEVVSETELPGICVKKLCENEFFKVHTLSLKNSEKYSFGGGKMIHMTCLSGKANIIFDGKTFPASKGDSYLFPAALSGFEVISNPEAEFLISSTF